jgi:CheY-like chemotaxis protein
MPEMGGLEACRQIREDGLNRHTPIIALTANAYEKDRDRCLSAGMAEVLTKPLQIADLQMAVARYAGHRAI